MHTILMLALAAILAATTPALAQEPPPGFDSRWTPYVGCWTIVQDQRGLQSAPISPGTQVCVEPSGRFGVTVTTTVDGKNVLEQTIVADGSAQPLSQADCRGTQTSNWSRDGERLFTRVELQCADRPARTVSGITLLTNGHWVDAQATVVNGYSDVRVRRYRRADESYAGAAAITSAPLSIEDVIEANANVQSPALEAALDEVGGRFTLNSRVLRQLADNGVPPNVIDLMIAQAYPDKFQVDRGVYPPPASTMTSSVSGGGAYIGSTIYPYPMYDPFWSSYYYYSPFAYPYYWGPSFTFGYGYPYYRNYYNYYGYPGSIYTVGPVYGGGGGGGGTAPPGTPDSSGGDGVVVNGRGYTRVRPSGSPQGGSSATPSSRTTGSSRGVRGIGSSGGDSSTSSPSGSSSSGSSSSGASSGGYSSGGGGDAGGGRTAQPR
jgi:hypothetical protein